MRIRLTDADRERLGCPEWLECDVRSMTLTEATWLADQGISPFRFGRGRGVPTLDARGEPVLTDDGEPLEFGHPDMWRDMVWLGLHRAGIDVGRAALDFQLMYAETRADDGEVSADEGKADSEAAEPETTSEV
jgi:hypothetical protein